MVVLVLTGCGASTRPPTAHFAAVATTICSDAAEQLAALPAPSGTLDGAVAQASSALGIVRSELRQLAALNAPPSLAGRFAKALAAGRAQTATVAQLLRAIRAGDAREVATLALRAKAVDARARAAIAALGLPACTRAAAAQRGGT
ncbi:MAG: hypothetical protein ABSC56_11280 [Solirubrobacteraceae bacterium]|jgi:hypothetical protein